jgi:uncharacterized damage-inducible protein DinB
MRMLRWSAGQHARSEIMLVEQLRALSRYNRWMNEKIFSCAAELSDAERKADRGAFFGSISGTLNHLLLADRVWLARFTNDAERFASVDENGQHIKVTALAQELYSSFEALRQQRERTDQDVIAWIDTLDESQMTTTLRFRAISNGQEYAHPLWWALTHFFNHQTHHRGQVTTLLMQAGRDPGLTDFLAMERHDDPSAS